MVGGNLPYTLVPVSHRSGVTQRRTNGKLGPTSAIIVSPPPESRQPCGKATSPGQTLRSTRDPADRGSTLRHRTGQAG